METNTEQMFIVIKENASQIYTSLMNSSANMNTCNRDWAEQLRKINGTTIEVETKFLFRDQFNTVPIEGVSLQGMRIMDYCVEKVINDQRYGKARCQYCGKTVPMADECNSCNRSGYLTQLIIDHNNTFKKRGYNASGKLNDA